MSKCVSLSCFCNIAATVAVLVILAYKLKDDTAIPGPWRLIESLKSARTGLDPPRNLHPPGLQVVDLKNFSFLINSDICGRGPVAIVTIVSSAMANKVPESRKEHIGDKST